MTRRCVVLLSLAGCNFFDSERAPTPTPDAGASTCEPPGVVCSTSASEFCDHNNLAETCYELVDSATCSFTYVGEEECDGTDVTSCDELGFYGGATSCVNCKFDASGCQICASTVSCTTLPGFTFLPEPAVSGAYVALGSAESVVIYSGITQVATAATPGLQALAGMPGGWLVATNNPPSLSTLDYAGARGPPQPLPNGANEPFMVSNSGGRAILIWYQPVFAQQYLMFAIADANANIIVPATGLFPIAGNTWLDATSDGTSFFIGVDGKLARVSETGTVTITNGFPPTVDHVDLAWSGTTGWYVASSYGFAAQRFDANGAPVGASFEDNSLADSFDFLGDGEDLVAVQYDVLYTGTPIVVLRRFAPNGAVTEQHIAGLGAVGTWSSWVSAAHFGGGMLVVWNFHGEMALALVP